MGIYVYSGSVEVNGQLVDGQTVAVLDADSTARGFELVAKDGPSSVMLFSGAKIRQPIAWHGPIVMNTDAEIQETFRAIRTGKFPPIRVPWDYRRIAASLKSTSNSHDPSLL